jgi:hypothetical protein
VPGTTPTKQTLDGNLNRNVGLKPWTVFNDVRVSRRINFNERMSADFIVDMFNIANRYNVADVNPLFTNAGEATAAYDPRQFQFALKFNCNGANVPRAGAEQNRRSGCFVKLAPDRCAIRAGARVVRVDPHERDARAQLLPGIPFHVRSSAPSARTRVVRSLIGVYDRAAAYEVLDEGSLPYRIRRGRQPFAIPTGTAGGDNLHPRLGRQRMHAIWQGHPVCLEQPDDPRITMNYRSVVLSTGVAVLDARENWRL